MQKHKEEFSIERMSKTLNVSRSGYYKFVKSMPSQREKTNVELLIQIKEIYADNRQIYGSPRIHAELLARGERYSRKRVARLMKKAGLIAKIRKRFKIITRNTPNVVAIPNLLQQDFTAIKPNQRWVADITYVRTAEGWLYVSAILDLFSRRVIGLAMSDRMTTDIVLIALQQAFSHRHPTVGVICHSDKGGQYTSPDFQQSLKTYGMVSSMSGTGSCYDNAAMESFFHTLKTELVYFERYMTREQAKQSIFEYIEVFYNRQRRHSTIGYLSPYAYEKQWFKQYEPLRCVY